MPAWPRMLTVVLMFLLASCTRSDEGGDVVVASTTARERPPATSKPPSAVKSDCVSGVQAVIDSWPDMLEAEREAFRAYEAAADRLTGTAGESAAISVAKAEDQLHQTAESLVSLAAITCNVSTDPDSTVNCVQLVEDIRGDLELDYRQAEVDAQVGEDLAEDLPPELAAGQRLEAAQRRLSAVTFANSSRISLVLVCSGRA